MCEDDMSMYELESGELDLSEFLLLKEALPDVFGTAGATELIPWFHREDSEEIDEIALIEEFYSGSDNPPSNDTDAIEEALEDGYDDFSFLFKYLK